MEPIIEVEEWHSIVNTKFQNCGGIIYSSSGSTQSSRSIIYTREVMEGAIRRVKESFSFIPFSSGSKIAILWGYGLFPPAEFYSLALRDMGNLVYPLGSGKNLSPEIAAQRITEIAPEIIIGMPSYIMKILSLIRDDVLESCINKRLRIILTGGEVLTKEYRDYITNKTGVRIYDSYGMLQAPMIAGECSYGKLHLSSEYSPEVIDSNQIIKNEGKGVLLLSSKTVWYPLKMFRLNTQDVVVLNRGGCPCGCSTPTIKILGRNNQRIKVRGQMVDFDEIICVLEKNGYEGNYYIQIIKDTTDKLMFYVNEKVDIRAFQSIINTLIAISYKVIKQKDFVLPVTDTGKIKHIEIQVKKIHKV